MEKRVKQSLWAKVGPLQTGAKTLPVVVMHLSRFGKPPLLVKALPFLLPLDETYDYTIDWGDGSAVESGQTGNATHSYATAGEYDVSITGTFPRIYFNNTGDKTKILEVKQWGSQPWTSMASAFYGCRNLNITAADVPDLTTVSSMESMFNDTNLSIANNINDWDVSNVTNMTSMFSSSSFGQAIGNWDTSNVTSMGSMFNDATAFNQDLSSWDTSALPIWPICFLAQLF